jgi:hypothetical protein
MSEADEVREKVLASAKAHAESQDWPWLTPVEVTLTRAVPTDRQWTVKTNAFAVGRNARIVVRESDMSIVDAGFLAR